MNTNEIIYIDAEMLGQDCSFEFTQRVALRLTDAGYPAQAFDTSGSIPRGYYCADDIPQDVWLAAIAEA